MEIIKEIYQQLTTQQPKGWRICRELDSAEVYRDFIKRLQMYCYPDELVLSDEYKQIIGQIVLWYCNDKRFKGNINKGIILSGNCGTGKTMTIEILFDIIEFGDKKKTFINQCPGFAINIYEK